MQWAHFSMHLLCYIETLFGSTFMNGIQVDGYIMYCVAEGKVVPRLC